MDKVQNNNIKRFKTYFINMKTRYLIKVLKLQFIIKHILLFLMRLIYYFINL